MKKSSLFILLIFTFAFSSRTSAQSDPDKRFDVQINLAPISRADYSLFAGYQIANDLTVGGVLGYLRNLSTTTTFSNGLTTTKREGYQGFYIAPELRYYFNPSDRGNDRWYAGVYLKYRYQSSVDGTFSFHDPNTTDIVSYDIANSALSTGPIFGYTWSTRIGLTFGLWAGAGYYLFDIETTSVEVPEIADSGWDYASRTESEVPVIDFRIGLNVGYRF